MRLIDADALKKSFIGNRYGTKAINYVIDTTPTVDAVEVVRCKDCRWGREASGNIECWVDTNIPPEYHGYEWFCPNGEERKNE